MIKYYINYDNKNTEIFLSNEITEDIISFLEENGVTNLEKYTASSISFYSTKKNSLSFFVKQIKQYKSKKDNEYLVQKIYFTMGRLASFTNNSYGDFIKNGDFKLNKNFQKLLKQTKQIKK